MRTFIYQTNPYYTYSYNRQHLQSGQRRNPCSQISRSMRDLTDGDLVYENEFITLPKRRRRNKHQVSLRCVRVCVCVCMCFTLPLTNNHQNKHKTHVSPFDLCYPPHHHTHSVCRDHITHISP